MRKLRTDRHRWFAWYPCTTFGWRLSGCNSSNDAGTRVRKPARPNGDIGRWSFLQCICQVKGTNAGVLTAALTATCRANLAEPHGIVVRFVGIADTVALKKPE